MNKEIVDAIERIKCRVLKNGIGLTDYFQLKKRISKQIDILMNSKLDIIKCVYYNNMITKDQYIRHSKIIESERSQYKKMLNFYGE